MMIAVVAALPWSRRQCCAGLAAASTRRGRATAAATTTTQRSARPRATTSSPSMSMSMSSSSSPMMMPAAAGRMITTEPPPTSSDPTAPPVVERRRDDDDRGRRHHRHRHRHPHRRPGCEKNDGGATAGRRAMSTSSATVADYVSLPHSSPEVKSLIDHHASKPQTSASLQTLMKTGRGELLDRMADVAHLAALGRCRAGVGGGGGGLDDDRTTIDGGGGGASYPLMDGASRRKSSSPLAPPVERRPNHPPPPSPSSSPSSSSSSSPSPPAGAVVNSEATPLVLLQVASFLRRELPIRLAHRINDLSRVPLLRDMRSVRDVRDTYVTSFLEILNHPKHPPPPGGDTEEWERRFASILENVYERHSSVLVQMARGAFELRAAIRDGEDGGLFAGEAAGGAGLGSGEDGSPPRMTDGEIRAGRDAVEFELMEGTHAFLDRFYISRIGMRVLIGQYLSLRQPPVENYVGIICSRTSPYEIVKRAIDDAAFMCARKYGDAPEVIITGRMDMTFPYVPTHLHYIMLELLKNSMRATVEYHGIDADYPPIKVVIADGSDNEDVIIKVSDEGGGIPRSNMKRIWSYLFTTADPEIQEGMVAFNENVDHSIDSPLAGLGYGLPISRSYARYFGGDLSIMSMEGYGTDCFVYLTRLGNTREPLPI